MTQAAIDRWSASAFVFAGLFGALAVAMAAAGAHGDPGSDGARWIDTGARYALVHCAAIIGTGALQAILPARPWRLALLLFCLGVLLFSGSLFAMALTGIRQFGAVTPVGGTSLIAAWLMLAWGGLGCLRRR